ncbi:transposase [Xenorhabdus budapestensis]|uniref:Transposase n=1 Tax=Xenorhabdus budapestensis TaxID=290110 RepID=A0A2D0J164_XENBU|nr:transposase [Xenorhabdus budapestensis]
MGYSLDFRKRILAYKDKHSLNFEQTRAHFDISMRTLFRWSHKIAPCMTRDKPPTKHLSRMFNISLMTINGKEQNA